MLRSINKPNGVEYEIMKKIGVTTLLILVVVSLSASVLFARENINPKDFDISKRKPLSEIADVQLLPNGDMKIIPHSVEEFINETGLIKPSENAKLIDLKIIVPKDSNKQPKKQSNLKLESADYLLKTGTSSGTGDLVGQNSNTCYTQSGCDHLQVAISVNTTESSGYSSSISVSEGMVEATVGYEMGSSYSIQNSDSYVEDDVPYNGTLYIQAYERINITGFTIWQDNWFSADEQVGSGSAWEPIENFIEVASWADF